MSNLSVVHAFIENSGPSSTRPHFGFSGESLDTYLNWAQTFGYLLVDSYENDIQAVGVAYPVASKYNGNEEWFYSFSEIVPRHLEQEKDICVMDFLAKTKTGRVNVVNAFTRRFPNWENQEKWALRKGRQTKVSNKTIKHLASHGF